jgi:hypothetical protein
VVVWTGWGILAALIWAAGLWGTQIVVDQVFQQGFYTAHIWPKIVGSSVSAPINWFVGRAMNGSLGDGRRVHGARHTLFWIPMEYWSPIFIVLGVVIALVHYYKNG